MRRNYAALLVLFLPCLACIRNREVYYRKFIVLVSKGTRSKHHFRCVFLAVAEHGFPYSFGILRVSFSSELRAVPYILDPYVECVAPFVVKSGRCEFWLGTFHRDVICFFCGVIYRQGKFEIICATRYAG